MSSDMKSRRPRGQVNNRDQEDSGDTSNNDNQSSRSRKRKKIIRKTKEDEAEELSKGRQGGELTTLLDQRLTSQFKSLNGQLTSQTDSLQSLC